jgi:hypothetical protein
MSNQDNSTGSPFFGEVVYSYSRAQALEDGVLIDVTDTAREAGFRWPVALSAGAWADCVAWSDIDSAKQTPQDESGRLWDVVFMAAHAVRTRTGGGAELLYDLARVPRDGEARQAVVTTLKLIVGPGDGGEPVVTILPPDED